MIIHLGPGKPPAVGPEAFLGLEISAHVPVRSHGLPWGWQGQSPRQSGREGGDWLAIHLCEAEGKES